MELLKAHQVIQMCKLPLLHVMKSELIWMETAVSRVQVSLFRQLPKSFLQRLSSSHASFFQRNSHYHCGVTALYNFIVPC